MLTTSAAQPLGAAPADDLAQVLLDVSLSGIILFRPLYATPGGPIQDLAYEHLNPAAQQMLRLPERPADTFLTLYPGAQETGIFAFYAAAFTSGKIERYQGNYQHDGLNGYFYLVARRSGERLVVSFTDTNDQPRSAVEEALRQSQAREQAARAEAEAQRQRLLNLLEQAPAMVATYRGPDHVMEFVNGRSLAALGKRPAAGRPFREVAPELASQGIFDLLDHVYRTGETYFANDALVHLEQDGQLTPGYYSFIYQATYDAAGQPDGILNFAYEVTDQVLARQRVQDLNEKLAAANEELAATNEEYLLANTALTEAQLQLQQLNAELEERVQQRTQQLAASSQQLAREREGFFQILEQTPAAICILRGPEHRIAYHNPAHQQLYGGRKLAGRTVVEGIPQVEAQGYAALLDSVYRTGQPQYGYEVPYEVQDLADGPLRRAYFNFTFSAYREAGQIEGISIIAYHVTEQVHLRQQREAQQAEMHRLFAQAPMAIVVLRGPNFIIEQVNESAEAIWGRTAAQVLGRPHFEAVPDAVGQGFEELLTGILESGEPVVLHEVPVKLNRTHTGLPATGYYSIIFKPLRDEYQRVTRIAVMWTEATDQVLARQQVQALNAALAAINEKLTATNEELHQSNTRLLHTNADLDNFVYTASHDLKSPISNIEGLLLLLPELLPEAVRTDQMVAPVLARMQESAERFRRTISHLTDVSRLQAEFAQPAEPVRLADVVEDVRQDLLPQLTASQAQLEVDVNGVEPQVFSAKNLRSIIYNLLSNAIKYRHPDRAPRVRIACVHTGNQLVLTVQDNGLGVSEQQQIRLFQLFQRLHTHVEGTGVGLYMVKRIVEQANGRVTVQSQAGVGTTFTLVFPASSASVQQPL
jgi:signal transduction histidine kinase